MTDSIVLYTEETSVATIVLNHITTNNSLNSALLDALYQALDKAETNPQIKMIVLQGQAGYFCTGMDFVEVSSSTTPTTIIQRYSDLLQHLATSAKIIIVALDGAVIAGGVGMVAAADLVLATPKTHFSLTEALWGLIPANILPYLIRRMGWQKSYFMTLTSERITTEKAQQCGLVDIICEQALTTTLNSYVNKLKRLEASTIKRIKDFFYQLSPVSQETKTSAIKTLADLVTDPAILTNIKNFIEHKQLPWEQNK